jgi:hypothetical protein
MRWLVLANCVRCDSFSEERRRESGAWTPWFSWSVRMTNV